MLFYGPVAQLVRAPPCHGGGRRFESVPGRSCKEVVSFSIEATFFVFWTSGVSYSEQAMYVILNKRCKLFWTCSVSEAGDISFFMSIASTVRKSCFKYLFLWIRIYYTHSKCKIWITCIVTKYCQINTNIFIYLCAIYRIVLVFIRQNWYDFVVTVNSHACHTITPR